MADKIHKQPYKTTDLETGDKFYFSFDVQKTLYTARRDDNEYLSIQKDGETEWRGRFKPKERNSIVIFIRKVEVIY